MRRSARALLRLALLGLVTVSATTTFAAKDKTKGGKSSGATTDTTASTAPTPSIPLATSPVASLPFADRPEEYDALLRDYETDQDKLQTRLKGYAATLIKAAAKADTQARPGPFFTEHDRIAFVFLDDHLPQPTLVRVLQGATPIPSPGSVRLLRSKHCNENDGCPLYTVYLYRTLTDSPITSTYAGNPTTSPAQTGLGQTITAIVSGISGLAAPIPTPLPKPPADVFIFPGHLMISGPSGVYATAIDSLVAFNLAVSGGTPPYAATTTCEFLTVEPPAQDRFAVHGTLNPRLPRTCSFTVTDHANAQATTSLTIQAGPPSVITRTKIPDDFEYAQITVTDTVDTSALFENDALARRTKSAFPDTFATTFTEKLAKTLDQKTPAKVVAPDKSSTEKDLLIQIRDALQHANDKPNAPDLKKILDDTLVQTPSVLDAEHARAIYQLYTAAQAAKTQGATTASTQTAYTFGSRTLVTFGLGAGAIFRTGINEPVTVSSGALVANPPNGVLTTVNIYVPVTLKGYNETTIKATPAEKMPRFVLGFVVTPYVGGFAGIAFPLAFCNLTRSLTVNIGYAIMVTNVPAGTAHIGSTGTDATTKRGAVGGTAATLGYTF